MSKALLCRGSRRETAEHGGYFTARRARRPLKLTKNAALGQRGIFVNSLNILTPKNGKVEFSSTVKPFYDHPLTEKYLPKAKLFVNCKTINVSSKVSLRRKTQFAAQAGSLEGNVGDYTI